MSVPGKDSTPTPEPPKRSTVLLLFGTIADTTWRMFVPVLGLMGIGVWMDMLFMSFPIGTAIGLIIGCGISTRLIIHQLNTVKNESNE